MTREKEAVEAKEAIERQISMRELIRELDRINQELKSREQERISTQG